MEKLNETTRPPRAAALNRSDLVRIYYTGRREPFYQRRPPGQRNLPRQRSHGFPRLGPYPPGGHCVLEQRVDFPHQPFRLQELAAKVRAVPVGR